MAIAANLLCMYAYKVSVLMLVGQRSLYLLLARASKADENPAASEWLRLKVPNPVNRRFAAHTYLP